MGTIRIEPEPPIKENVCDECGGTNRLLHGYVYEDDSAHGVYFVEWCDGLHPDRAAFMTVGLGAFGAGTDGHDRAAFCVSWRSEGMSLANEPARDRPDLLGEFVPRTAALEMPRFASFSRKRDDGRNSGTWFTLRTRFREAWDNSHTDANDA